MIFPVPEILIRFESDLFVFPVNAIYLISFFMLMTQP